MSPSLVPLFRRAITGSLDRIDIRGKGGVKLADAWEDGPITYLGLQVMGFPNLFTLVGPHTAQPSATSAFAAIYRWSGWPI